MMYLLVSQHVSGITMPIIRRMVQNRQRLWCTALAVLQKTLGEEVVGVHLLGMVSPDDGHDDARYMLRHQ
jgi:hypothetical protein